MRFWAVLLILVMKIVVSVSLGMVLVGSTMSIKIDVPGSVITDGQITSTIPRNPYSSPQVGRDGH